MGIVDYTLFRVKLIRPRQTSIHHDDRTPRELLLSAINEKPSLEQARGPIWHIGNVRELSPDSVYFAIGRTTVSTIEKYDEETGNFIEELLETSPYTHCVLNAGYGFVGIARKTSVYSTAKGFAGRLEALLGATETVARNELMVAVDAIPDPEGFLAAIDAAYCVRSFTAHFTGPNPLDADEYFQKPLSVYLSKTGGTEGKATVKGKDLNRRVVQEVARSTAATGNEASARLEKVQGQPAETVHLRGNLVQVRYDEEEHSPEQALEELTEKYQRVRDNA